MHRFWLLFTIIFLCLLSACPSLPPDKPGYWKKALGKARSHTEKTIILSNLRQQKPQDAAFLSMLHEVLAEEKSPDVKAAIVRILADMRHPSSLEPLRNALSLGASGAHTRDLNRAIAEALVALKVPEAEPVFLEMLRHGDVVTLLPAVEGLGQLRSKEAVPILLEMLEQPTTSLNLNEHARHVTALGQIAAPEAIPVLEKKLYTALAHDAALALFRIGKPAADALLLILQEKNSALIQWADRNQIPRATLRAYAASVLGDMQELRAENTLMTLVRSNELPIGLRVQAITSLGRMRSAKAVPVLNRVVLEREAEMRRASVLALAHIGDKSALSVLQRAISASKEFEERVFSMTGIALLGGEAELAFFNRQIDAERVFFGREQARLREEARRIEECANNACEAQIKRQIEQRMDMLLQLKDILETGSRCAEKEECWVQVLADVNANGLKRQRAAFFLGRSKKPEHFASLGQQLKDDDLEVRRSALLGLSWLVADVPSATEQAKALIQPMQQQMEDERGRTQFASVRDEMLRVLWTLQNLP